MKINYNSRSNSRLVTQSLILLSDNKKQLKSTFYQTCSSTFTQKFLQNNKINKINHKNSQYYRSVTLKLNKFKQKNHKLIQANKSQQLISQCSVRTEYPISKVKLNNNKFQMFNDDLLSGRSVFISKKLKIEDYKKGGMKRIKISEEKSLFKLGQIQKKRQLLLQSMRNMQKCGILKELHKRYTFFGNNAISSRQSN